MGLLSDFFNPPSERNIPTPSPQGDRTLIIEGNDGRIWTRIGSAFATDSANELNRRMQCYLRDYSRYERIRVVGQETGRLYDMLSR